MYIDWDMDWGYETDEEFYGGPVPCEPFVRHQNSVSGAAHADGEAESRPQKPRPYVFSPDFKIDLTIYQEDAEECGISDVGYMRLFGSILAPVEYCHVMDEFAHDFLNNHSSQTKI